MKQKFQQHLIPTDKPSRLWISQGNGLRFDSRESDKYFQKQTIIVTSDEAINKGCKYLDIVTNHIYEADMDYISTKSFKKIIASTDKDLTPDRLIPNHWVEHTANKFNAGEPIKTIELEMNCSHCEDVDFEKSKDIDENCGEINCKFGLKTENGFVIVAEKGEEKEFFSAPNNDESCWTIGMKEFTRKEVSDMLFTQRAMIGNDLKTNCGNDMTKEMFYILDNPRIPKF